MCKDCGCGATNNKQTILSVPGMMCEHCQNTVEGALLKVPSVMSAEVDLEKKTATVNSDQAVTLDQLVDAVSAVGFDVDTEATVTNAAPAHYHSHSVSDSVVGTFKKLFK